MTVTYLFRSAGTGHSIETLFNAIRAETNRRPSSTALPLQVPHISRGVRSVWQNFRFVAKQRIDGLVHITGDVHYAALALPGSRTILTIHDCITLEKNQHNRLRYWVFWLLWYYWPMRRAAVVTTISEKTRKELIRRVGKIAEKVIVVPNAYDPIFTSQPRPFRAECPVLLQIGTAPHKNLPRLIEALAGLPCRLLIVGPLSADMTIALETRQIAYENHVNLSQTDIVQLYTLCDVVTFVSLYEGFGMPILEANAVGRPVLTSNIRPLTDVGGSAVCYVDPTNVASIRAGIRRLCEDETYRADLIRAGQENIKRYTVQRVAKQYNQLYNSLLYMPTTE